MKGFKDKQAPLSTKRLTSRNAGSPKRGKPSGRRSSHSSRSQGKPGTWRRGTGYTVERPAKRREMRLCSITSELEGHWKLESRMLMKVARTVWGGTVGNVP